MKPADIQKKLLDLGFDGWLFCDFQNRDRISYSILGLPFGEFTTRRWFYYLPAIGEPTKIVHSVEAHKLDVLPGKKVIYHSWEHLYSTLKRTLSGQKRVAMQYSPSNNIPYIDLADPGMVELVRSLGCEVVSSADLVQLFEARLSPEQLRTHKLAAQKIQTIKNQAFVLIEERIQAGTPVTEWEVSQFILRKFREEGLTCDNERPIVAIDAHAADPHFAPSQTNAMPIEKGSKILIDLWARLTSQNSIYYDITWCGYAGKNPPKDYQNLFDVVVEARDAALDLVTSRLQSGRELMGWEVDATARNVIEKAGYGKYFVHRTGHSIGTAVHGNGVHIDNLETKDERKLIPGICFSIEPGIYLPNKMGVRTEIDVFIDYDSTVEVEGEIQRELILLDV